MTEPAVLLRLRDVRKSFPIPDGGRLEILRGINLDVDIGQSVAIVGPSGSGKSTLLSLIGGLDRPDSGTISLDGQRLDQMDDRQLTALRARYIGFVFQLHYLLPQCTVLENVLLPVLATRSDVIRDTARERAIDLLRRVGLGERMDYFPGQLSGGERQRVAVVRALIHEPMIVLADEPTGSLDQESAANLADLLVELNQEFKVALIVVTHSLELARRMRRIYELRHGVLQEPGNAQHVLMPT